MPFSSAFAQGLEIGRTARKERAVAGYFEKLKALQAPQDVATPTAEPQAIPTEQAGEGMVTATNRDTALPTDTPSAPRVSLGRADLQALDDAAMEAARASGDISVFTALKSNTDVFLQGKLLNNLRTAQMALANKDMATAEKAIRQANYYVPNGQDIQMSKSPDGQLTWIDPISGKSAPITAESIGYYLTMASDPRQYTQLMAQLRQAKEEAVRADRNVVVNETNAAAATANAEANTRRAETDARQAGDTAAYNRERLKIDRILADAKVLEAKTYSELALGGSGKNGALTPADRASLSKSIREITRNNLQPTKTEMVDDGAGGQKPVKVPQPGVKGFEDVTEQQIGQIAALAEAYAIKNPTMPYSEAVEAAKKRYLEDKAKASKKK